MSFNENILEMRTCKLINDPIYFTLISLPVADGRKVYVTVYGWWLRQLEISTCLRLEMVKL